MKKLIFIIVSIIFSINCFSQGDITGDVEDWSIKRAVMNANFDTIFGRVYFPDQDDFIGVTYTANDSVSTTLLNLGTDAGDFNTFLGQSSGRNITRAKRTTGVGFEALYNDSSGWSNTAVGYRSLYSGTGLWEIDGQGGQFYANTAIGQQSGYFTTLGSYNTFLGVAAGFYNTTGNFNSCVGVHSGDSITTGSDNVFMGFRAGRFNAAGNNNVGLGSYALAANQGSDNTAIGRNALPSNVDGLRNLAVGRNSGLGNISGNNNVFFGVEAGYSNLVSSNIYIGYQAGYNNAGGTENVYIGMQAGVGANPLGSMNFNTVIGFQCGNLLRGSGNTLIGYKAGDNLTLGHENIIIGKDIDADGAGSASTLNIGNVIKGDLLTGSLTYVQLSGSLTDGAPTEAEINTITSLTPVTAGAGWTQTIIDTDGTTLLYRVESDGTDWFYTVMNRAL